MDKPIEEIVISDFYLKTNLNREFVNKELAKWQERIEDMYDLHYPRMFLDPLTGQLSYESNHIDSLALDIIDERENLTKYKRSIAHELMIFDKTISKYTSLEQKQIKQFQVSNDFVVPDVINKLKRELYELMHSEKQSKQNGIAQEKVEIRLNA